MESSTKNRVLALLVALTAGYAAVTVVVLVVTGSFGPVWFAASLLVYGVLAAAGIALAVLEPEIGRKTETERRPAPAAEELALGTTEAIYTTPTGRALSTDVHAGLEVRRLLFTVTRDEVRPIDDVETRLDAVDLDPAAIDVDAVEDELVRRHARNPHPHVDPDTVDVEVVARTSVYRTATGRLDEAVYRTPGGTRRGLFALVDGEATPIETVERRLDRLPVGRGPDPDGIQEAIDRHGRPEENPAQEPKIEVTNA